MDSTGGSKNDVNDDNISLYIWVVIYMGCDFQLLKKYLIETSLTSLDGKKGA
jgi:hypothetical protein